MFKKGKAPTGIILIIYCVLVFVGALFGVSAILNRGNTDMTVELSEPSIPTMVFTLDGMDYNLQYGYLEEMTPSLLRDCITPLEANRNIAFRFDTYGNKIERISYKLRSLDGSRLIEEGTIYNYLEKGDSISAEIRFKDLIESGKEYSLCILAELGNGKAARYYSRIIDSPDLKVADKLKFAYYFTNTTYDRTRALSELTQYMESNRQGDNSSFAYTNIHSSMNQLIWGNLPIRQVTMPIACIRDISSNEGSISFAYYVGITQEEKEVYGYVNEEITLREGKERYYLINYERTMEQCFDIDSGVMANNKIVLGITKEDTHLTESSDGKFLAFVSGGKVFSYGSSDNRMSVIYDPYDREVEDLRKSCRNYRIKVFSVEETGNVWFMIYGYQSRGIHEGQVGTAIYLYDGQLNTIEEMVYVPYRGSVSLLYEEVEELAYVNSQQLFYMKLQNTVYCINIKNHTVDVLSENIPEEGFVASNKEGVAAWVEGTELYGCDTIILRNLRFGSTRNITAEAGCCILPIGFFGDAFIYGEAKKSEIVNLPGEAIFFPMHHLQIVSPTGTVLKDYKESGIVVTKAVVSDGMVSLERMKKEDGKYVDTLPDQILNNVSDASKVNTIQIAVTDNYETICQIALRKDLEVKSMKTLYPRYVLFEGDREMDMPVEEGLLESYFVYKDGKHITTTTSLVKAIQTAKECGGTVQNGEGLYLYRILEPNERNQIMILKESTLPKDTSEKHSLAACVEAMCYKEGIRIDGESMLAAGKTASQILEENIPSSRALSLYGLDLDTVLSYVQQDYPVLVQMKNMSLLLIGYNQTEVVLWDPVKSGVYKITRREAAARFAQEGNPFITYIRF